MRHVLGGQSAPNPAAARGNTRVTVTPCLRVLPLVYDNGRHSATMQGFIRGSARENVRQCRHVSRYLFVSFNHGVLGSSPSRLTITSTSSRGRPERGAAQTAKRRCCRCSRQKAKPIVAKLAAGVRHLGKIATILLERKESPKRLGDEKRLGLTPAVSHFTAAFSFHAARVQAAPRSARSLAASVDQTPHSPQLKVRRSGRPPVRGVVRVRCIDRPQFGHGGRTMVWLPTGRFASWNASMIPRRDAFQTID